MSRPRGRLHRQLHGHAARAAFAPGTAEDSAKLRRLVEIADEATADGRKVVLFSFFRDVLDVIGAELGPKVAGPLTGSVPPSARQAMVDEFTACTRPSVLVSQIQAGGVALQCRYVHLAWGSAGTSAVGLRCRR